MQREWDQGYGSSRSFKPVTGKKCSGCWVLWTHSNTSGLEVTLAKPLVVSWRTAHMALWKAARKLRMEANTDKLAIPCRILCKTSRKVCCGGLCCFPASSLPCFHFMEAAHTAFRGILLVVFAAILLFGVYVREKSTRLTCYFMHLEKQWLIILWFHCD